MIPPAKPGRGLQPRRPLPHHPASACSCAWALLRLLRLCLCKLSQGTGPPARCEAGAHAGGEAQARREDLLDVVQGYERLALQCLADDEGARARTILTVRHRSQRACLWVSPVAHTPCAQECTPTCARARCVRRVHVLRGDGGSSRDASWACTCRRRQSCRRSSTMRSSGRTTLHCWPPSCRRRSTPGSVTSRPRSLPQARSTATMTAAPASCALGLSLAAARGCACH